MKAHNGSSNVTPVYTHWETKKGKSSFTAAETGRLLRSWVKDLGSGHLGISPEEVGTHSIQASFAMALILGGTPVFKVMLVCQ